MILGSNSPQPRRGNNGRATRTWRMSSCVRRTGGSGWSNSDGSAMMNRLPRVVLRHVHCQMFKTLQPSIMSHG